MQDQILNHNHLQSLNPQQLKAVENLIGPGLILAGAGTGKTKVLTTRIAHLILSGKAYPSEILAVTFTNKAAKEMQHRVSSLVDANGIWLGTFHAIAAKILRKNATLLGLSPSYNIIDTDEQLRLIKMILRTMDIDDKKYPPKMMSSYIQRWKDLGLKASQVRDHNTQHCDIALKVYQQYQERLQSLGAVDFGDLLLYNIDLFTKNPYVLNDYQDKFQYILVDEYQDTNIAQYIWLRMLAQKNKNICCVGDEDQSIYGWRGAEIANILRFEEDFPQATIVRLEQNYRSSNHILKVASQVIANNKMRLGKVLWTAQERGEKVQLVSCDDDRAEARFVAMEISAQNVKLSQIAILVRAGFQTRAFEECFMSYAIKYKVVGGLKFYERLEVKDVIAYIRLALRMDDDLALERVINMPKRGIGEVTIKEFRDYANLHHISLFRAIEQKLANNEIKPRLRATISQFVSQVLHWHELFDLQHHAKVVETIIQQSGYFHMWKLDKSLEAEGRVENIIELIKAIGEFNNITEFLHHVTLVSDVDEVDATNMVNIMTLHAAKGLEFDYVFLPGWEEGLFPHQRSLGENGIVALEEERRLAYVGITRARYNLYISYVNYRRIYNQVQRQVVSRFVKELPAENINKRDWKL